MSTREFTFGLDASGSGRRAALRRAFGLTITVLGVGCGIRFPDGWDGSPVLSRETAAPTEILWRRLVQRAGTLELALTEVRPERRLIQFDWITAPGDGRLYLRCSPAGPIGSASLRPRVVVRPASSGSLIVVSTEVRATAATTCRSTGQFEDWLLDRLEPAIADAMIEAATEADPSR